MNVDMKRRTFLKRSAVAGAGLVVLKSGILKAGRSPNEKLNIAIIGVGGQGGSNMNRVKSENIVALCDLNANNLAGAAKRFPRAKTYRDWRKCLDQKDIDAVVCSTTDHTHAFINVWAMNRGMHVYCEKPLANSVHEARVVRETYLKNKHKLATQMGTQIQYTPTTITGGWSSSYGTVQSVPLKKLASGAAERQREVTTYRRSSRCRSTLTGTCGLAPRRCIRTIPGTLAGASHGTASGTSAAGKSEIWAAI
jgi:hypothetical protein